MLSQVANTAIESILNGMAMSDRVFPDNAITYHTATEKDIETLKQQYKDALRRCVRQMFKMWRLLEKEVIKDIREKVKQAQNSTPSEHV